MQSLVQLGSSSTCQTLTPKLCTILKRTMASADTRIAYGNAKYCPESWGKAYRLNGGNTAIKTHLKSHGISEDSPRQERAERQQSVIDTTQKEGLIHPQKRRRLNDHPGTDIDGDTLDTSVEEETASREAAQHQYMDSPH